MKQLEPITFAHPLKKNGFKMREVEVYIYSTEAVLSFKSSRPGQHQTEPDYVCVCHIPDLDFVDTRGYMMSLIKRVHRERINRNPNYTFDFVV